MSNTPQPRLIGRLMRDYIRHHRRTLVVAVICMIIMAGCQAANAYMMQPVLDDIFVRKDASLLLIIPLAIFALSFINAAADYGQSMGAALCRPEDRIDHASNSWSQNSCYYFIITSMSIIQFSM